MSLTFGLTGMDPTSEAALKAAFDDANARLGKHWRLVPEGEADHVVVDMDSMYGPMSWLKLHAAGKTVIGLTSSPRTQTDFILPRSFTADTLTELLETIGAQAGVDGSAATSQSEPSPAATAIPSGNTPAPAPQDQLPEEQPRTADEESQPPPEPVPPPPPPREPAFADWLAPDALPGRRRFQRGGDPALLLDIDAHTYHGPKTLKPLLDYFEGKAGAEEFADIDDDAWASESAALGAAQPLSRLIWYGALLSGRGALLPGMDPAGQYRLGKWPQTEREFPKHFRIATAMMKGPATLPEISQASGVPQEDVADFINASLATGFAEPWVEPPPELADAQKSGLFGRLRGR